jgi:thiol-disulfide isomerase/thioredoxin
VGPTTVEEILTHPAYLRGMEEYEPSQQALDVFRSFTKPVLIEVFFGSWCPHCKRIVPMFMKSISEVDNPMIQIAYIGVPPPPFGEFGPVKEKDVEGVPAFIVSVEEVEVGRVQRIPSEGRVEIELARILEENK